MIDISNIDFRYKGSSRKIFNDFSLKLQEGHIYGLLGKNGTGKSTLLYLISGLLYSDRGLIKVDEFNARLREVELLRNIFIVPEEYDLPAISLDSYVKINHMYYPNFSDEVLKNCIAEFDIEDTKNLSKLSMGQKKKVYISIALASGTKYLLMDEPTNGLDIPSKAQFRSIIGKNADEGRTIIISTHQVKDIESLVDHVVIIDNHRLVLDMSCEEILKHYAFELLSPEEMIDRDIIYAEPTLQGNYVISHNKSVKDTAISLELLFNAVNSGLDV